MDNLSEICQVLLALLSLEFCDEMTLNHQSDEPPTTTEALFVVELVVAISSLLVVTEMPALVMMEMAALVVMVAVMEVVEEVVEDVVEDVEETEQHTSE